MKSNKEIVEEFVKKTVSSFLEWRLPNDFSPDGGISFKREFNECTDHPMVHEPVGTNLFDARQATEMIQHILGNSVHEALTAKDQQCAQKIEEAVREERERILPYVERVRLDVNVIVCDCGEKYKDSDLDLSVGELEQAITKNKDK